MENLYIGLAIALLAFLAWRLKVSLAARPIMKEPFVLPPGVTLRPQPLLTDAELLLYNLIRLAVEDHYLVFAKVPLWSVVSVETEGTARSQVLRQIALKQLDFVLLHPGSKLVEQVVLIEEDLLSQPHEIIRRQEIQPVLQTAGIRFTALKSHMSYTVPQLAQLFGVGDDA